MKINIKNIRYISIILILAYAYFFITFFMQYGDFSKLIPTLMFLGVTLVFGALFLFMHLRYDICSHCSKEIDWEKIDREL